MPLAAMVLVLTGCGGGSSKRGAGVPAASGPTVASGPTAAPLPTGPSGPSGATGATPDRPLALGIAEENPVFVRPGDVPAAFVAGRDAAAAIRPDYYRLVIDWSILQGEPDQPANLTAPHDGCVRGVQPCAPWSGIREQLEAVKAAQQAQGGGWQVVVLVYGVPEWAALSPRGCERPNAEPRSRPVTAAGLAAYGQFLRDLRALADQVGVDLPWLSPFNEPNQPAFISPQRRRCSLDSPPRSPAVYAQLVREARRAVAGTDTKLLLGELAGFSEATDIGSGVGEFIRALPDDVACAASAWAQHEYAAPGDRVPAGSAPFARDAVAEAEAALDERSCTATLSLWVTETGVGGRKAGLPHRTDARALRRQCAAMAARLERWAADPRVAAAFTYTVRDDPLFPVGWTDPGLTRVYPVARLWQAWGEARGTTPPPRPAGCT